MKKIVSIIGAVALVATLTSCKKNWTCECCTTCGGSTACASGQTEKLTKKKATDKCNEGDREYSMGGGVTCKVDCSIK